MCDISYFLSIEIVDQFSRNTPSIRKHCEAFVLELRVIAPSHGLHKLVILIGFLVSSLAQSLPVPPIVSFPVFFDDVGVRLFIQHTHCTASVERSSGIVVSRSISPARSLTILIFSRWSEGKRKRRWSLLLSSSIENPCLSSPPQTSSAYFSHHYSCRSTAATHEPTAFQLYRDPFALITSADAQLPRIATLLLPSSTENLFLSSPLQKLGTLFQLSIENPLLLSLPQPSTCRDSRASHFPTPSRIISLIKTANTQLLAPYCGRGVGFRRWREVEWTLERWSDHLSHAEPDMPSSTPAAAQLETPYCGHGVEARRRKVETLHAVFQSSSRSAVDAIQQSWSRREEWAFVGKPTGGLAGAHNVELQALNYGVRKDGDLANAGAMLGDLSVNDFQRQPYYQVAYLKEQDPIPARNTAVISGTAASLPSILTENELFGEQKLSRSATFSRHIQVSSLYIIPINRHPKSPAEADEEGEENHMHSLPREYSPSITPNSLVCPPNLPVHNTNQQARYLLDGPAEADEEGEENHMHSLPREYSPSITPNSLHREALDTSLGNAPRFARKHTSTNSHGSRPPKAANDTQGMKEKTRKNFGIEDVGIPSLGKRWDVHLSHNEYLRACCLPTPSREIAEELPVAKVDLYSIPPTGKRWDVHLSLNEYLRACCLPTPSREIAEELRIYTVSYRQVRGGVFTSLTPETHEPSACQPHRERWLQSVGIEDPGWERRTYTVSHPLLIALMDVQATEVVGSSSNPQLDNFNGEKGEWTPRMSGVVTSAILDIHEPAAFQPHREAFMSLLVTEVAGSTSQPQLDETLGMEETADLYSKPSTAERPVTFQPHREAFMLLVATEVAGSTSQPQLDEVDEEETFEPAQDLGMEDMADVYSITSTAESRSAANTILRSQSRGTRLIDTPVAPELLHSVTLCLIRPGTPGHPTQASRSEHDPTERLSESEHNPTEFQSERDEIEFHSASMIQPMFTQVSRSEYDPTELVTALGIKERTRSNGTSVRPECQGANTIQRNFSNTIQRNFCPLRVSSSEQDPSERLMPMMGLPNTRRQPRRVDTSLTSLAPEPLQPLHFRQHILVAESKVASRAKQSRNKVLSETLNVAETPPSPLLRLEHFSRSAAGTNFWSRGRTTAGSWTALSHFSSGAIGSSKAEQIAAAELKQVHGQLSYISVAVRLGIPSIRNGINGSRGSKTLEQFKKADKGEDNMSPSCANLRYVNFRGFADGFDEVLKLFYEPSFKRWERVNPSAM
ncbi:uncharacterized protein MYCFIDRAFT_180053 [Pseudocercospora fijiensis CIRAD86]|uniref:Uncharacterized protein n=1 Tax=Pseudocercospora fijiensis (strain CIRAD86) TaxID=383855 RepID=M3AI64_PSEFD|nr:uncharacterized protein MYCFIDRAFT_180053 [Pseudocercospora fijiensis CIRAD86]EME77177.1 hypothetical protein MYCFIDRAFT_180053 [Pseudocercospora fijiensis CIRAD86]